MCFRETASKCFQWSPRPRRPRWVQEPPDPWKGAFWSPWCQGALIPSLSPEAARGFTSRIWELLLSRRVQPGHHLLSPLRFRGRCPEVASVFSGLWPGASEVVVARWGQGKLVGSRPEHTPSPLRVCVSFSANSGSLHTIGAELGVRGRAPGMLSAKKGLRPAPGL